ncbi:uncharacterized protein N7498_010180 [Penicillium cinerascens]|uniref:Uncharacterized protein n=1 Tax=Penicillium cinerascens TaxID=70096 RepID=A0A9W9J6F3_9EURO|nr:uncharacterized protein N7498_010180 [Penicillium cinerascens]KAJ5191195.1 hypothetical protein N7498_010180 [Penicillium cinerascens]
MSTQDISYGYLSDTHPDVYRNIGRSRDVRLWSLKSRAVPVSAPLVPGLVDTYAERSVLEGIL